MPALVVTTDAPFIDGPPQGQWTYADWEALPDDGLRYEIINGVLYMTTAPKNFHQWIIRRLDRLVGIPAEDQGLGYVFTAPIGLLMPGCDPVQPDLLFVRAENAGIIREGRIRGVPDLLVEVLSPGTRSYDERVKLPAYAAAGVPEYAIVDPETRTISRYLLQAPGRYAAAIVNSGHENASFACLPTLPFRVSDLFAGAPDESL
jgi:Uma2 family endonuclease